MFEMTISSDSGAMFVSTGVEAALDGATRGGGLKRGDAPPVGRRHARGEAGDAHVLGACRGHAASGNSDVALIVLNWDKIGC